MKSLFSELIKKYPEESMWSWRDKLQEEYPGIMVTELTDNPYVLFRYSIGCDFKDPLVQEARGIILDKTTGDVVCWPFRKFGKYYEPYADTIDWSTARVLEKIDGSIIKLWYDRYNEKWVFSTNGVIYAEDAQITQDGIIFRTFMELIKEASNYGSIQSLIDNNRLSKDTTYIFELVHPDNRVVLDYTEPMLYHIGTRNNITGEESDINLGIDKPEVYFVDSLENSIKLIDKMCVNPITGKIDTCDHEGFVVVDANWNRIKVKSSIYQILHNIVSGTETSRKELIKLLYDNKLNVSSICDQFPELAHHIKYYDFNVTRLIYDCNAIMDVARKIYRDSGYDRKIVAESIKDHPYKSFAFQCLDNDKSFDDIISNRSGDKYSALTKLIEPYKPTPINAFSIYYTKRKDDK